MKGLARPFTVSAANDRYLRDLGGRSSTDSYRAIPVAYAHRLSKNAGSRSRLGTIKSGN